MKERIKNLLISGVKPVDVAGIVGCTPSYVSQLLKDEDFKKEIQDGLMADAAQKTEDEHLDTRYRNMEHKLLGAMEESLAGAELPAITHALKTIASIKNDKKAATRLPSPFPTSHLLPSIGGDGNVINVNVTNIALPSHITAAQLPMPAIRLNSQSEIIEIDGKSIAPMSSDGVKKLFSTLSGADKEQQLAQQQQLEAQVEAEL